MREHIFKILAAVVVVGMIVVIVFFGGDNSQQNTKRLGKAQEDKGVQHVASAEQAPDYGGPEPPTSGPHGQPVAKGAYNNEVPDYQTIHNLEHGYVYISYRPDIPKEQVNNLRNLFFPPFSNPEFKPNKVIMAPREANESPIIMSSWTRSKKFEKYNQDLMMQYYLDNVNQSPEPLAQ
jgi:hypothetical protein